MELNMYYEITNEDGSVFIVGGADATLIEQNYAGRYRELPDYVSPCESMEKAEEARKTRNDKLSASDWTQVADAPVDKTAWATYRQALRDISEQEGFPWTIEWPESP
jgi:gentisate 1,2-dioxygenase